MAASHTAVTLVASVSSSANNTKSSCTPSTGVDLRAYYGGVAHYKFTNGGSAPGVAPNSLIELSPDNSNWFELGGPVVGDTTVSSVITNSVKIPAGAMYARTRTYGHTTNAVTIEWQLSMLAG